MQQFLKFSFILEASPASQLNRADLSSEIFLNSVLSLDSFLLPGYIINHI